MAKTPRRVVAAQAAVAVAIVGLGVWALQPGGYVRPVAFTRDEGAAHLPADQPQRLRMLIRLPGIDAGHLYYDQGFKITVDPAGRPVTVTYQAPATPERAAEPAIADAAIDQLRTWRFVPFEAEGKPVHAWFVEQFTLVPEQDRPATHIPFPPITDVNQVVMTYDETGIRRLPRTVTVHGDGTVEITNTSVLSQQHFQATIPRSQVLSLIDRFRRADFFSLGDAYGGGPSDSTARKISITIDGQIKTVGDYEGQFGGLPNTVIDIENALQRAGGLEP